MNRAFNKAVERYRTLVNEIAALPDLAGHVQNLVDRREGPSYTVQKPVVYNAALDEEPAGVRMILVADNPGRREQEQGRYLVGPSGKIAEKFFREKLGLDFRANVLILNKTPIHTPRTAELKTLCAMGGKKIADAAISSQKVMAELLYEFWAALSGADKKGGVKKNPLPVWIIGYSEMKKGGVFEGYTEKLAGFCAADPLFRKSVLLFRHFSMNQFTIDLGKQVLSGESVAESLERIGAAYRERILVSL